ncbi:AraC family transcriptional regulator [Parablautia intestinalis]|uniref:AraC family transcriptional regulator n=1 Tax=Parablautia intestinalis TaxID=2320100 RepID=UPI00259CA1A2|nr:AraC family transcriptional regulator [Parablautia intestinalis]
MNQTDKCSGQIHSDGASCTSQMHKKIAEITKCLTISEDFQIYSIKTPFAILLETCREQEALYNIYQFTQYSCHSSQMGEVYMDFLKKRPLHQHSCIEVMCVLSGAVTNHVENQVFTYEAGQCCIMNKNIHHCEEFTGDFQAVFLMMQDDFIAQLLAEYQETDINNSTRLKENLIFQLLADTLNGLHQFDKVYLDCFPVIPAEHILEKFTPLFNFIIQELVNLRPGSLFFIKGAFSRLLQLMADPGLFCINRIHSELSSQEYLFSKITHIMRTSHGRCTREELSSQLHYNAEYLNRIMKKYTGKTILEYGRNIYLEEARMLLADTDKSISSIIEELGFSNRSHFYRLFENRYNETPMDCRRRIRYTS